MEEALLMIHATNQSLLGRSPGISAGSSTSYQHSPSPTKVFSQQKDQSSSCCLFVQGSGTNGVQRPFAVCVVMFLLGYLALWALGWGGGLPVSLRRSTGECITHKICITESTQHKRLIFACCMNAILRLPSHSILFAGLAVGQGVCSYGDLPGYWTPVEGRTLGNWTLLNEDCRLEVRTSVGY